MIFGNVRLQLFTRLFFCTLYFGLVCSNINAEDLFLFGGGDRPTSALQAFIDASGGPEKARILVIPWATQDPVKYSNSLKADMEKYLVDVQNQVVLAPTDPKELLDSLNRYTGIFFLGGDQRELMTLLRFYSANLGIDLSQEFRNLFHNGLPIAGTSAGTAIMSKKVIVPAKNRDHPGIEEGIGFLPDFIVVDQHHTARNRALRLMNGTILANRRWGLGVDEDGCVHYSDGEFKIISGDNKKRGGTFYHTMGRQSPSRFETIRLSEKPFRITTHFR